MTPLNGRPGDPVPTEEMAGKIMMCRWRERLGCPTCSGAECQKRQGTNKRVEIQDCIRCIVNNQND